MAKKYQKRPDDVTGRARSRGYLTPLDLFKVAAWKTGQGLGYLTLNTEDEITSRTRAAIDCIRPWHGRKITAEADDATWDDWRETARHAIGAAADQSGLRGLQGVGYPMATAILDILDPCVWPVIDRWASQPFSGPVPMASSGRPHDGNVPRRTQPTSGTWSHPAQRHGARTFPSTSSTLKPWNCPGPDARSQTGGVTHFCLPEL
jgi:hypothetical protein